MSFRRQNWILLLAAGACATLGQNGGDSLLRGPLRSARQLAPYRRICVLAVPACGWTDVAAPRRVTLALH
jgi:hypothetical protein